MNYGVPEGMREEFSVWIFFPDGSHVAEVKWVDAKISRTQMTPTSRIASLSC
jgi:hypothetical protein